MLLTCWCESDTSDTAQVTGKSLGTNTAWSLAFGTTPPDQQEASFHALEGVVPQHVASSHVIPAEEEEEDECEDDEDDEELLEDEELEDEDECDDDDDEEFNRSSMITTWHSLLALTTAG
jgi:hypothetical protein